MSKLTIPSQGHIQSGVIFPECQPIQSHFAIWRPQFS